ncbi:hypothetical protein GCM10007063_01010 [Lentibacillus kapialis]|uniref:Uncharacterized protein n=1 Tax=Lentibacillus kapialis TaxID=340214 RepID=A0A917USQ1_9BACI|nr:hypothetical protein GCM10007063_01010 [Lentibacillus kapialis]
MYPEYYKGIHGQEYKLMRGIADPVATRRRNPYVAKRMPRAFVLKKAI